MTNKNKILGNIGKDTHKEVILIKGKLEFKNINQTLKFLIDCYKFLKQEDIIYIINNNLEQEENIKEVEINI